MDMPEYQVALVYRDATGVVSRPLIVLNLKARDEAVAAIEARAAARMHRPPRANAFELVRHGQLVLQEGMD